MFITQTAQKLIEHKPILKNGLAIITIVYLLLSKLLQVQGMFEQFVFQEKKKRMVEVVSC